MEEEIMEEEIMEVDREEEAIKDSEEEREEEVQEVTRIRICPEEEARMLKVIKSLSPTDSNSITHTLILALVLYLH